MIFIALIAFAIAVYLFIHFIIKRDHGHKEPTSALFIAMGYGVLAVVIAVILNEILIPREVTDSIGTENLQSLPKLTLLRSAFMVGLIEESAKIIPFAFFIYKKRYFDELTDGIIYFGVVGLTFGIIEDVFYSINFGGGVGLLRIILTPYLHTSFTILFGMCLIQRKVLKKSWLLVFAGYIAAIAAHGLFDFFGFIGGAVGVLMVFAMSITLNVMLFIIFRRSQRIDESRGQSAIGINKYCRHCGKPNPDRLLFCSYCGKHS